MHQDVAYAKRALEAGASGFVLKHSAASELVTAIHAALEGKTYLTPALAKEVLQAFQRAPESFSGTGSRLTPRQREILQLLAEGCAAKEIAGTLGISVRTVEFHKYQMMEALDLHNSAELVHYAIKHGIITI
jgi:DNA-binding NarL/FixJ family response regulator